MICIVAIVDCFHAGSATASFEDLVTYQQCVLISPIINLKKKKNFLIVIHWIKKQSSRGRLLEH